MKARYENRNILVDFNNRGWNGEIILRDVDEDIYYSFVASCENFNSDMDIDLEDLISIIIDMTDDGIL